MATKCSSDLQKHDCLEPKFYTGLIRDTPDDRDLIREYGGSDIPSTEHHPVIDLRKYVHKVYDQGKLSSCSANIVCAAYSLVVNIQADKVNQPYSTFDPSRLFVYYNARLFINETDKDAGAQLRDALKAMHHFGVCEESQWPYDELKFALKPPKACYDEAAGNTIYQYVHLGQSIDQLRACLKEGFPFVFGFEVYKSFIKDAYDFGYMTMPSDEELLSTPDPYTHGAVAVGYDDRIQCIFVLNSWGERFGDDGYFYMPYKYITNTDRAFDFWKIEKVNETL